MGVASKADAMTFAIEKSTIDQGVVNCEQADKIYRMFVDNIKLPEHDRMRIDECLHDLNDLIGKLRSDYLSPAAETAIETADDEKPAEEEK